MKRMTFEGFVDENGVLRFPIPAIVREFLLTLTGCAVDVQIGKHYKRRTERENRYYWGVIIPLVAAEMGDEDPEFVHASLQVAVGHYKIVLGEKVPLGTSKLSTVEFEEYASKARMFASKFLNLYLPEPNEGVARIG